jgi:hypothetical protein
MGGAVARGLLILGTSGIEVAWEIVGAFQDRAKKRGIWPKKSGNTSNKREPKRPKGNVRG